MGKKSTSEIKIEGETSLFSERIRRAQGASRSGNWRAFKEIFQEDKKDLLKDLDLFKNTAINVATRSDSPQLLKELLEMLPEQERWVAFTKKSCEGNTLLHEIVLICKVVEMADVVLDFEKKMPWPLPEAAAEEEEEEKGRPLLERKNSKGETPLFRAAKYENLKMVIHLAKAAAAQPQSDTKIHLRSDTRTILHASINVQSFDGNLDERYEIEGYDSFELFRPPSTDLETSHQHDDKPPTSGLSRINYDAWKYLARA
ncbi:uncharacterized protein LOC129287285 [Prosopis cineraria]|uniref:uncharacterized protein LOC129287285 n=1 Tax=Prosopis cineraria TaxID=364024 RepID=UPI00240EAC96|nr:uncharacterized protein LOC129287285 [Prosopis cineraria]